ncbi:sporulation sigma-E factor-processing peptidase [Paenibacillus sp. J31TS4]|uniref:sigma-E processing peptidase SpoIIGA n=1 Tax=Paenibacillus sp. J31TS4 TaxID=2807195 RepID=UPI001B2E22B8|nr:sigma-E processing peptidase SpoIIGA [Paenibacillus sp. J31TS4]GIP39685.1 sporulation sigma-E factor-processing peptidase [Paenibacillus sp. J31TS4]
MVIYLDLIFLWNLAIDGGLLYATARLRGKRASWLRLTAAAGLGAGYSLLLLYPELSLLFTFVVKLLVSVGMIGIAFGFGGTLPFLRTLGAFYVINFVTAGAIFGLHYFFLTSAETLAGIWLTQSGGFRFQLSTGIGVIGVGIPLGLFLLRKLVTGKRQQENLAQLLAEVRIRIEDSTVCCKALIDTGNRLYDPLTRTPVMVVQTSLLEELPDSWNERIRRSEVDQLVAGLEAEAFRWQDRLRLVPYRGINKGTQFMLAIKPDGVSVHYQGEWLESTKVLVGLDAGRLSEDGGYEAILHPDLVASLSAAS